MNMTDDDVEDEDNVSDQSVSCFRENTISCTHGSNLVLQPPILCALMFSCTQNSSSNKEWIAILPLLFMHVTKESLHKLCFKPGVGVWKINIYCITNYKKWELLTLYTPNNHKKRANVLKAPCGNVTIKRWLLVIFNYYLSLGELFKKHWLCIYV